MDVAVKTIMKKNIPKTQSLLKKEIDILRVNIQFYSISLYYTILNIIFNIFGFFEIINPVKLYFISLIYLYIDTNLILPVICLLIQINN